VEFKNSSENFISEVKGLIRAIGGTMYKIIRKKKNSQNKNLFKKIANAVKNVGTFIKGLLERIKDLNRLRKTFKREKKDILLHKDACVQKLSELRAASLCNTCSGRSQVFFNGTKARIQMDTCRAVINECHEYWTSVINVINTAHKSRDLIAYSMKFLKSTPSTSSIDYLANWIKETKLKVLLEGCVSLDKCTDENASLICNSLITIKEKKTIEMKTSNFVANQTKRFKDLMEYFDPGNKLHVPENVDAEIKDHRLLMGFKFENIKKQKETFDYRMFSDVMTVPTNFGEGCEDAKPMKMDHVFP
jgi:hypothetical protein